jgi:hypothetical protein
MDLSEERKAAYRGLVAPYLLEIDRETRSAEKEHLRVSPPARGT